jgi:hypothetical protein
MEVKETLEELKAELVTESSNEIPPIKKARGRPRRAKVETDTAQADPATIDAISPELVEQLLSFGFDYIAERRGEHWKLTEQENKQISLLSSRVANKYLPEWLAKFGDEIALSTLLGFCLLSRLRIDSQIALERKGNNEKHDPTASEIVADISNNVMA